MINGLVEQLATYLCIVAMILVSWRTNSHVKTSCNIIINIYYYVACDKLGQQIIFLCKHKYSIPYDVAGAILFQST